LKIAIIAPLVSAIREPQRGGSQSFVSDLARGLAWRGHQVDVYAARGSEIAGVRVIDTGIDPASLADALYRPLGKTRYDLPASEEAFARVCALAGDNDYDLVHNHAFDRAAIRQAAALRARVVHTLHLPPDNAIAAALHDASQGDRPPIVATVSAPQARAWRAIAHVDAVLLPLVPTGEIPWSAAPGDGVVFAGRFSPEKGVAEAIEIARAAGIPIEVFGDVYDADYARDQVMPRQGDPHVTIRGHATRSGVWRAMARTSVVLCPAMWDEPFGMAAAEAQACGTPVVGFRCGGLADQVVEGVTGFLVEPGDIAAAAAAARRAAGLSRQACRDHATRRLDLQLSLDAHEELYRRATVAGFSSVG
jgi:glycosyltransferase involved in cell wall biosynthesis